MAQQGKMSPAVFDAYFSFQHKIISTRRARVEQDTERKTLRVSQESAEDGALFHAAQLDASNTYTVAIPSGPAVHIALSAVRRRRFRQHLQRTIKQALALASSADVVRDQHYDARQKSDVMAAKLRSYPALSKTCDKLCTACKGGCCSAGGEHAFITVITVRRLLDSQPERCAATLLTSYLDWVPEESMQGSCIYHTGKGCALPRSLRSDICNAYFCDPVREYQGRFIHAPKEQLFVIRRDHDNWNRFDKPEGNTVVDTQLLADGLIDVLEC